MIGGMIPLRRFDVEDLPLNPLRQLRIYPFKEMVVNQFIMTYEMPKLRGNEDVKEYDTVY